MINRYKIILAGTAIVAFLALADAAFANHLGGNISPSGNNPAESYAWNDVVGWMNFDTGSVVVSNTAVVGTANALQIGPIALDCSVITCTGAAGSWGVANDGNGNLSGWAWNDNVGWISFSGSTYQVKIDPTNGDFSGWAWNDAIGWISFNCNNSGIGNQCSASNYKIKTSWTNGPPPPNGSGPGGFDSNTWLISSIFDTQVNGGAALNSILWQGDQPSGTRVGFQIASSNSSSGPWNYLGYDGTSNTVYEPGTPNKQMKISRRDHNNKRYVRYEVFLGWSGSQSPRVDDVVISYSP